MLIAAALSRGLNLSDLDSMTIGGVIDFVITYNNSQLEQKDKKDNIRMATQEDFNKF